MPVANFELWPKHFSLPVRAEDPPSRRIDHHAEPAHTFGRWLISRRAAASVYHMADIAADEHVRARGAIVDVDGTPMQGLIARLSATPGAIRWAGRALDADGNAIRDELTVD